MKKWMSGLTVVTMLLSVTIAVGCKTVDGTPHETMESLANSHESQKSNVETADFTPEDFTPDDFTPDDFTPGDFTVGDLPSDAAEAGGYLSDQMPASLEEADVALVSSQSPGPTSPAAEPMVTLGPGEDLRELLENSQGVVLLDFYADWCGPCREQSKVLHELEDYAASVQAQIVKVNVEEHPDLQKKFKVVSLPTLVAVKDGTVVHKKRGLTSMAQVEAMLR